MILIQEDIFVSSRCIGDAESIVPWPAATREAHFVDIS
jgi:hypothetical protein